MKDKTFLSQIIKQNVCSGGTFKPSNPQTFKLFLFMPVLAEQSNSQTFKPFQTLYNTMQSCPCRKRGGRWGREKGRCGKELKRSVRGAHLS
jgi:hypothetical protein